MQQYVIRLYREVRSPGSIVSDRINVGYAWKHYPTNSWSTTTYHVRATRFKSSEHAQKILDREYGGMGSIVQAETVS